jgi:hypothetical protein
MKLLVVQKMLVLLLVLLQVVKLKMLPKVVLLKT